MRKFLVLWAAFVLAAGAVADDNWESLQIGFWQGVPENTTDTAVYGVKVGVPFCAGQAEVVGVETAIFGALGDKVTGIQCSLISTVGKAIQGLQFAPVNVVENMCGLQLGIFNYASGKTFQIGIINIIENGPVPFLPVLNFNL